MDAPDPGIRAQLMALWPWEALAVALAILYLVLAIRENRWCWPAGIASTAIYFVLFLQASLYAAAVLQLFYIGIAVYGWRQWSHPGPQRPVVSWGPAAHARVLAVIALLAVVNGALLAAFTDAALPYADTLISWAAVLTTWLVARKVLENWLYWFVIDVASAWLYASRGLWLTAGLFLVYVVMVVFGYLAWRRRLREATA